MSGCSFSPVQLKVYRALLKPGCYLREIRARKFVLVNGHRVMGLAIELPVAYRTVQSLLGAGHIKHGSRIHYNRQQVGYFAVSYDGGSEA